MPAFLVTHEYSIILQYFIPYLEGIAIYKKCEPIKGSQVVIIFSFIAPGSFCPGTSFHNHFNCHSMTACLASFEEVTITLPGTIVKFDAVGVVIPIKSYQEVFYMDAFTLFSIAFGFLPLAYHA